VPNRLWSGLIGVEQGPQLGSFRLRVLGEVAVDRDAGDVQSASRMTRSHRLRRGGITGCRASWSANNLRYSTRASLRFRQRSAVTLFVAGRDAALDVRLAGAVHPRLRERDLAQRTVEVPVPPAAGA